MLDFLPMSYSPHISRRFSFLSSSASLSCSAGSLNLSATSLSWLRTIILLILFSYFARELGYFDSPFLTGRRHLWYVFCQPEHDLQFDTGKTK